MTDINYTCESCGHEHTWTGPVTETPISFRCPKCSNAMSTRVLNRNNLNFEGSWSGQALYQIDNQELSRSKAEQVSSKRIGNGVRMLPNYMGHSMNSWSDLRILIESKKELTPAEQLFFENKVREETR
jgi:predicted nucleic acid-binding Zn ribbon protein